MLIRAKGGEWPARVQCHRTLKERGVSSAPEPELKEWLLLIPDISQLFRCLASENMCEIDSLMCMRSTFSLMSASLLSSASFYGSSFVRHSTDSLTIRFLTDSLLRRDWMIFQSMGETCVIDAVIRWIPTSQQTNACLC